MSQLDSKATAVALEAIRRAFPERPFPRGTAIAKSGRWFDEAGKPHVYESDESSIVARFFAGAPWWNFPGELLLQWRPANVGLRFLTPQARAYYLPAYMTALLATPLDPVSFAVLESAVSALTAPVNGRSNQQPHRPLSDTRSDAQKQAMDRQRSESFQDFINALDDSQRTAVATFLRTVEPLFGEPDLENEVTIALDTFWRRYSNDTR